MRREGTKFTLKSNHTLRSNDCIVSRKQTGFGSCSYHSRILHEDAYQYLSVANGDWERDEAEVWKQANQWKNTTSRRRVRLQTCVFGLRKSFCCYYCNHREDKRKPVLRGLIRSDIEEALKSGY